MGRQTLDKRNIRKLSRTGGGKSVSVTIPLDYIKKLKWKVKQKVVVKKIGNKLLIEDWKK